MVFRLLQQSVQEAERVVGAPLPAISHFAEEQSAELRDRIFDEFNSLAVVLRAPSATFIQETPVSPAEDVLAPGVSTVAETHLFSSVSFAGGGMVSLYLIIQASYSQRIVALGVGFSRDPKSGSRRGRGKRTLELTRARGGPHRHLHLQWQLSRYASSMAVQIRCAPI